MPHSTHEGAADARSEKPPLSCIFSHSIFPRALGGTSRNVPAMLCQRTPPRVAPSAHIGPATPITGGGHPVPSQCLAAHLSRLDEGNLWLRASCLSHFLRLQVHPGRQACTGVGGHYVRLYLAFGWHICKLHGRQLYKCSPSLACSTWAHLEHKRKRGRAVVQSCLKLSATHIQVPC